MAYDYDKLYGTTPQALGEPTQVFVDFFNAHVGQKLRVLDIGCGQGRDALFIGRMGHAVVAVDISPNGIRDLNRAAENENLDIQGIVEDIDNFEPRGEFSVLLIDRTLHMLPEAKRISVFRKLLDTVAPIGWVLIADERANIGGFKAAVASHKNDWAIELEKGGGLFLRRD